MPQTGERQQQHRYSLCARTACFFLEAATSLCVHNPPPGFRNMCFMQRAIRSSRNMCFMQRAMKRKRAEADEALSELRREVGARGDVDQA